MSSSPPRDSRAPRCEALAAEVLDRCLSGSPVPDEAVRRLLAADCAGALFSVVAEGLSDRFEPTLSAAYTTLFARVIAMVRPEWRADDLVARYERLCRPRTLDDDPAGVFLLSRVTLGADVAITSVMARALATRLPSARIAMVGSTKLRDLFAGDSRIEHVAFDYPKGTAEDRIAASCRLAALVSRPDWIVVDPDSRLTQLGLVPVCDESRCFYFASRDRGADGDTSLTRLTQEWVAECFGVSTAMPYVAPAHAAGALDRPAVAVSIGVGGNDAKRVSAAFEIALVRALVDRGAVVYLDGGGDPRERARADAIATGIGSDRIRRHDGSFATFAALIAAADLYVGYDSSGQHVAAASGVPFVSIFAGYASPRVLARWRPTGSASGYVVDAEGRDAAHVLDQTLAAIDASGALRRRGLAAL